MSRGIFCRILLIVVVIVGILGLSGILSAQGRSEDAFEHVRAVQERNTARLMELKDVEGTAIGLDQNGRLAIKVFTARKGVAGIPKNIDRVPVQVVVTGKILALSTGLFERPVPIGVSTGNANSCSSGTIACRVTDSIDVYALSNNHVYALENTAPIGSEILQPGLYDTGCIYNQDNVIGTLDDFEPIVFRRWARNEIDAAIALSSTDLLDNATPSDGYGTPSLETATASVGLAVQKYGRTTGLTSGEITGINATVNVGYSRGTARFVKQIIVESDIQFIGSGDSGSLLVTDNADLNPVGLLFAGTGDGLLAVANRIDPVLNRFGVTVDGDEGPASTTGSISGTVTASDGTSAIEGATVSVVAGQSATTGADGTYNINGVPTGDRFVTASAAGFESQTKTAAVNANQETVVDFALAPVQSGGALNVDVRTDKGTYTIGERMLITVTVTADGSAVEGVAVDVQIITPTGKRYVGEVTTDSVGEAAFKFKIKKPDGAGTYNVDADASKSGYDPGSGSITFEVE